MYEYEIVKEQNLLIKKRIPDLTDFQFGHAYCIQGYGIVKMSKTYSPPRSSA